MKCSVFSLSINKLAFSLIFLLFVALTGALHAMDVAQEDAALQRALAASRETAQIEAARVLHEEDELAQACAASMQSLPTPLKPQIERGTRAVECDRLYQDCTEFQPFNFRKGSVNFHQLPVLFQGYGDLLEGLYKEQGLCGYYALYNASRAAAVITEGHRDLEQNLRRVLNDRGQFERDILAPAVQHVRASRHAVGYVDEGEYGDLQINEMQDITQILPNLSSIIILNGANITTQQRQAIQGQSQRLLSGKIRSIAFVILTGNHWLSAVLARTPAARTFDLYVFDSLAQKRSQEPCITQLIDIINGTPPAITAKRPAKHHLSACQPSFHTTLLACSIAALGILAYAAIH